ncbi:hypothetical protein TYRP_015057 [Tyrophagus putrescentiae]|nr:hypothetical protein TYRP_015057 [Tyrophagus putrescentiae]
MDHPPNKKSQDRLNSHSHGRHGRSHSSHSHSHGHKSSADNKKNRSKKSLHSQKNASKNKCVSGTGSTIGGSHLHHTCKSKDQPVTMSIAAAAAAVSNLGLHNQPVGLRWIAENIGHFGGNKDSVELPELRLIIDLMFC